MTLLATARFDNLCEILADLKIKDVRYKLIQGVFRTDAKAENMTDELMMGVDICREGLGMALARQQSLCLVCKTRRAARPYIQKPGGDYRDWCEQCWYAQITQWTPLLTMTPIPEQTEKEKEKMLCLLLI